MMSPPYVIIQPGLMSRSSQSSSLKNLLFMRGSLHFHVDLTRCFDRHFFTNFLSFGARGTQIGVTCKGDQKAACADMSLIHSPDRFRKTAEYSCYFGETHSVASLKVFLKRSSGMTSIRCLPFSSNTSQSPVWGFFKATAFGDKVFPALIVVGPSEIVLETVDQGFVHPRPVISDCKDRDPDPLIQTQHNGDGTHVSWPLCRRSTDPSAFSSRRCRPGDLGMYCRDRTICAPAP